MDLTAEQKAELEMLRAIVDSAPDANYLGTVSGYILAIFGGLERNFYDG